MNKQWTHKEEKLLKILSKENKTIQEIKLFINKSNSSIRNKMKRLNLNFNNLRKKWSDQEIEYLKKHYYYGDRNNMCIFLNRTWGTIKHMANKLNLKIKEDLNLKIPKNRFKKLDNETNLAYYWIGFLLADGCFTPQDGTLSLEISKKDEHHLDNFINFLNYGNKKYRGNNVCISTSDYKNIPNICKKFDIKKNKTKHPPNVKQYLKFNNDLLFSLFIGFADGDGNIRMTKNGGLQLTLENYKTWKEFHIFFEYFMYNMFNMRNNYINHQRYNNRKYSCISICNKNLLLKIKEKINILNLPVLNRKWDIIN